MSAISMGVVPLSLDNFNEAAALVIDVFLSGGEAITRWQAEDILSDKNSSTRVLTISGSTKGVYVFKQKPNSFNLVVFAISPGFKKTKAAYALYKDMLDKSSGKDVFFGVFSNNDHMLTFAKKRAEFISRSATNDGNIIEHYKLRKEKL